MASAAELDHLIDTYQAALSRIAAANEGTAEQTWRRLASVAEDDIADWLERTAMRTGAARRAAAELSATFFDSYVAAATGADLDLAVIDIDTVVARIRGGADARTVWVEPIERARRLAGDTDIRQALGDTAAQVGQIADQDVTLAARQGTIAANERHGITRFRRHPEAGACVLCVAAAQRTYSTAGLRPVHGHCHCVTVPDVTAAAPSATRAPHRARVALTF